MNLDRRLWAIGLVLCVCVACDDGTTPSQPCDRPEACPIEQTCVSGTCAAIDPTDSDGDGVPDAVETIAGTDPARADTDRDGPDDGEELGWRPGTRLYEGTDSDGDGRIDALESALSDMDGDGLSDQLDPCDDDPECPERQPLPCESSEGEACIVGLGVCAELGVTVCAADGADVECVGEPGSPGDELCSGMDEDCDGETDEGFAGLGDGCEAGVGACAEAGMITCSEDGSAAVCDATAGEPRDELCNEGDDDCDGSVDEDFPELGLVCDTGLGACNTRGVFGCSPSGVAVACDADVPEAEDERCNAIDDDCDGRIDETFGNVGQRCTVGVGACLDEGAFRCTADTLDSACDAVEGAPSEERCNAIDDDCDGAVDEGFDRIGEACIVGTGECARPGALACDAELEDYACDAEPGPIQEESCNERDDDCDGETDEGFAVGSACADGVGACRAEGVVACDPFNEEPVCSARPGVAVDERCNDLDDDCDGSVDEAFPSLGDGCEAGVGACAVIGELVCTRDQQSTRCSADEAAAAQERCNDVDDDCDGLTDEGFELDEPCTAGLGVCLRPGRSVCAENGLLGCDAEPGAATPETCDGQDEDCDGAVDEDYVDLGLGAACSAGIGACRRDGEGICADDGASVLCDAEQGEAAGDETCNEIDDDCDGITDEGFADLRQPCTSGLGECAVRGQLACGPAGVELVCDAEPLPAAAELCNRDDDDCDGETDEDFADLGQDCEVGIGACRETGTVACGLGGDGTRCTARAGNARAELCNDVDDDCDGATDENFGPGCERLLTDIAAGGSHTCGLEPDGTAFCFGDIDPPPADRFVALAAGDSDWHCGLTEDSDVVCWGDGPPALFEPPPGPFTALALGTEHGCALDLGGGVTCWGVDRDGETTPPPGRLFARIDAGPTITCGIASEADSSPIVCWGGDENGRATPPPGDYAAIAIGTDHGCAIDAETAGITCWGDPGLSRLDAPDGAWDAIDAGGFQTCGLSGGLVSCWGAGQPDEGPQYPHFGQSTPPADLAEALPDVVYLSVGGLHVCAADAVGRVSCWGAGSPAFEPDGFFHVGQATIP